MLLSYKRIYLAAVSLVMTLAFGLLGQASAASTPEKRAPERVVVATVDGKEITREEVEIAVDKMMPLQSFHSFVSEKRLKAMQQKAIEQIIDNELIYKAAVREKIGTTKKEIDSEVEKLKKKIPEGQTLKDVLKRSGMTEDDLREELSRGLVVIKMTKMKNEQVKKETEELVSEKFIHDYYKKNMDKFRVPEKIHLRSILFRADPAGGQRVWNEARTKAMDLTERARRGEDFAELARKHSEDPLAKSGGDMGWAHKGSLFDEIDMAASNLKVGEISDPVMTIYGYHVVKVEGRQPSVQLKYGEINKDKLKSELLNKEYKRIKQEWLDSLRSKAKIEYLRDLY